MGCREIVHESYHNVYDMCSVYIPLSHIQGTQISCGDCDPSHGFEGDDVYGKVFHSMHNCTWLEDQLYLV